MNLSTLLAEVDARQGLPPPSVCRALREMAGLSQEDVAGPLQVSRAAVSRWENGTRRPRRAHLVAYAELLAELRSKLVTPR